MLVDEAGDGGDDALALGAAQNQNAGVDDDASS